MESIVLGLQIRALGNVRLAFCLPSKRRDFGPVSEFSSSQVPARALRAQLSPLSVSRPIQTEAFHMCNFNRSFTVVSILLMALILGACQGTTSPLVSQDAPLPPLPVIQLHHGGRVYDGPASSQCWPVEAGDSLCADEGPFPWKVLDTARPVPVATGDSITVEVEADGRPDSLQVAIYDATAEQASDASRQAIELEPKLEVPFGVDLPEGTYFIRISGRWAVGDVAYKFKLAVSSPSE